jgi:hypothetical protein
VACHARLAERLTGPRPGGPVQRRSDPRVSAGFARAGRARDAVTTHGPHVRRCGTLAGGPVARCTPGAPVGPSVASGKEGAGGAH